jgi:hypothetical protein
MFPDLPVPSDDKFVSIEDLVDALRPVEMLTKRLCEANFNVLKVAIRKIITFAETFFHIYFYLANQIR